MIKRLLPLFFSLFAFTACATGVDSNTKLYLQFEGADAATSTTDLSENGHAVTFVGTAQIDTAQYKFGVSSVLFDGNSDYLTLLDSASWDICGATDDNWTVDFWIKFVDHADTEHIMNQYEDNSNYWSIRHVHGKGFVFYAEGASRDPLVQMDSGYEVTDTSWHHYALIKVGSAWGVYIDGNQTDYTTQATYSDTFTGQLVIGARWDNAAHFDGWIDDCRIQHSNVFSANPVVGETDTITVPPKTGSWDRQTIMVTN